MPDDPNKKMDELLKAYAKERRKSPELNLHPATRKMLQSEVTRVFDGRNPGGSWLHLIRSFWPQLAFGGSLCLILGIAVVSLRQPSPPAQRKLVEERDSTVTEAIAPAPVLDAERNLEPFLKKADELERTETDGLRQLKREQLQPTPALEPPKERIKEAQVPAPTTRGRDGDSSDSFGGRALSGGAKPTPGQVRSAREDNVALKDQSESKATDLHLSVARPAPSQLPSADARSLTAESRAPAQPLSDLAAAGVAGPPPASVPNVGLQISAEEKLMRANEMTNLGAARRLQFVQAADATASAPVALFTSFQMEQLGTNVRFFENDGSVYFGLIAEPTNVAGTVVANTVVSQRQRILEEAKTSSTPTNALGFAFTAQGTNRTLGKNVVLTGRYLERTNAATSLDTLSVLSRGQTAARGAQAQQAQHMIIGTAVIGSTNQVPVRAVSRD